MNIWGQAPMTTCYSQNTLTSARAGMFAWAFAVALAVISCANAYAQSDEEFLGALKDEGAVYANGLNALNRGLSKFEVGDYTEAAATLGDPTILETASADLGTYFLGESLFHSGRYLRAFSVLKDFNKRFPTSKWRDFATSRRGDVLAKIGKPKEALAVFQSLLNNRPDYPHPGALKMAMATQLIALDRWQAAADFLDRFVKEYPRHVYRQRADTMINQLARRGVRPSEIDIDESFRIARSLRRRRLHEDGVAWTKSLLDRDELSKEDAWMARYHHARMLLNARRFRLAIQTFETLEDSAPNTTMQLRTHKWRSRAYEGLGNVELAIDSQNKYWQVVEKLSPKRRIARGELYLRHGDFSKASQWFKGASLTRNRTGRRLRVLKPIAEFSAGRSSRAMDHFQLYEDRGFGRERPIIYWRARVDAAMGNKSSAVQRYQQLAKRHRGYYAEQARARLKELGIQPKFNWLVEPAPESAQPAQRFKTLFGAQMPDSDEAVMRSAILRVWRERGDVFPDLKAAFETVYVGRNDDSIWHLRRVANELIAFHVSKPWRKSRWTFAHRELLDYRKGPRRGPWGDIREQIASKSSKRRIRQLKKVNVYRLAAQLAFIFEQIGDYHYVLKLNRIKREKGVKGKSKNRRDMELLYPKAYRTLVEKAAAFYEIEPYILWALMRTESRFNTLAISPAEARGLMQVIWQTSQRISEAGGFVDMGNAQILLPRVSIALGAYYTSILLNKFSDQKPLAFAGYNAGPHRVASWLDRKPSMKMDQFVEEIQYEEARLYVKKVLEALLIYRRLYERDSGPWIEQKINRNYLEQPDY